MPNPKTLEVQQGIWIDERWLQSAGLGSRLQVFVLSGEIRIVTAPAEKAPQNPIEEGWAVFRSLGKNAPFGKLANVSKEHDRYLYGKK